MITLSEYADQHTGRKRSCAICLLEPDLRYEIDEALRNGIGLKIIDDWLRETQKLDLPSVQHHKQRRHYLETM